MKKVKKWGEDKPVLLVVAAGQAVSSAQDIHQMFRDIKDRRIGGFQFPLPKLSDWYRLYRFHRRSDSFIRGLVSDFSSFSQDTISFVDDLSGIKQTDFEIAKTEFKNYWDLLSSNERESYIRDAQSIWKSMLDESYRDLERNIGENELESEEHDELVNAIETLEGSFYFLIHVPCWLLYHESPTRLYRKARCGDYDALEKLFRLDALMIHDPVLGRQVQQLRIDGKRFKYENLMDAVLRKPKSRITRKKMKYSIAGFVSGLSHAIGKPLDAQQITDLFDAVAADYRGLDSDEDIPNRVAFNKAIQRDRAYWMSLFNKDIKN